MQLQNKQQLTVRVYFEKVGGYPSIFMQFGPVGGAKDCGVLTTAFGNAPFYMSLEREPKGKKKNKATRVRKAMMLTMHNGTVFIVFESPIPVPFPRNSIKLAARKADEEVLNGIIIHQEPSGPRVHFETGKFELVLGGMPRFSQARKFRIDYDFASGLVPEDNVTHITMEPMLDLNLVHMGFTAGEDGYNCLSDTVISIPFRRPWKREQWECVAIRPIAGLEKGIHPSAWQQLTSVARGRKVYGARFVDFSSLDLDTPTVMPSMGLATSDSGENTIELYDGPSDGISFVGRWVLFPRRGLWLADKHERAIRIFNQMPLAYAFATRDRCHTPEDLARIARIPHISGWRSDVERFFTG